MQKLISCLQNKSLIIDINNLRKEFSSLYYNGPAKANCEARTATAA